jgi:hypothetical protein
MAEILQELRDWADIQELIIGVRMAQEIDVPQRDAFS